MRRYSIWAIVAACSLTVIWSGLWFYVRGFVETKIELVLENDLNGNATAFCGERNIGGFPFRLVLACSPAGITVNGGDFALDLRELNVTALAYNPQHVVAEYSGPLIIASPASERPVRAEWTKGLSSVRITGQSFSVFSTLFENLAVSGPQSGLKAVKVQFHARPVEDEGLTDLAFSADDAEFRLDNQTSAPFFLAMVLQVNATPQQILAGSFAGGNPSLQNIDIRFRSGKSQLAATGNLFLSDDGTANGELLITAKNLKDLAAFLRTLPEAVSMPAQQTVGYLIALGRPGTDDSGEPVSQLTMTVRNNGIFAGDRLIARFGPDS